METQNIEFKSSWRDEYMKIICASANTEGGELILGVDDKGKPIGLKNVKKLLEDIPNKVKDILGLIPQIKLENKRGKEIIKIKADIFFKAGLIEAWGRGTVEILNFCKNYGLPEPDWRYGERYLLFPEKIKGDIKGTMESQRGQNA